MIITWPRSLALLGALALVACGAQGEPSTTTQGQEPVAAHVAPVRPAVPALDWAPCGEAFPGVECAVAEVPLDYDRPRGETTFIALARIPGTDQAHRTGTVFYNPGGPGGSGVDEVLYFADFFRAAFIEPAAGRLDVVGFDPRGVARSDPLLCFDTLDEENEYLFSFPQWWTFPWQRSEERAFFDFWQGFTDRCLTHGGHIRGHMSTGDVARDLDLLRQAVGDDRLTYLGLSYGTFLGETYASLFPGRIRAMVLDGVIDPRTYSSGWNVLYWRFSNDRAYAKLLRLCDAAGTDGPGQYNCPLSGPEGAAARWSAFLASLRREPLQLPDGSVFTYDVAVVASVLTGYSPSSWTGPDGWIAYFDSLARFAEERDQAMGLRALEVGRSLKARLAEGATEQEVYGNTYDASAGIICSDQEYPDRLAAFSLVGNLVASHSTAGPFWWWNWGAPCSIWPVSPDRVTGPWEVRTSAPVLLVGNYFDGMTDYSAAVATSRLLEGSRLLSYAGWGHCAIGHSECALGHMARYLADGTLPPKGTVCPAPPNPFLPPAVSARSLAAPSAPKAPIPRPPAWLVRQALP